MKYRKLGTSELEVSVLSVGAWEFGNPQPGFVTGDQVAVDAVVGAALDAGINLFDTAQVYSNGRSEEMLGKALAGRRDEVLIATKFLDSDNWDKDDILRRLKASLTRLGTHYVDLYQMHWPRNDMDAADVEIMLDAFGEARQQGLAREVGISNFRMSDLALLPPDATELLVSNQVPYSLLWRFYDIEGAAEFCRSRGISFLPYCPLAQGLLTGRFTMDHRPEEGPLANSKWMRDDVYPRAMAVVDEVKRVADQMGCAPAQVALRWLLEREVVASIIVGTTKVQHLESNLKALECALPAEISAHLDRASLHFQECLRAEWRSTWGDN